MVTGYVLSENDRVAVARTVAKAGGTPLAARKLDPRHRIESGNAVGYDGYFAVVDASETAEDGTRALKIRVIDGADSAAANCGYVRINNTGFEVAVFEKSVTTSSYLYLKSTLDTAQKPPVPGTPSFVLSPGRAGYEDESCYILIARIIVKDNTLRIIQEQHGEATGIIWGECEGETVS